MEKKKCFICNETKSLELFYKHKQMKDGHLNKCIECCKNYSLKYNFEQSKNVEFIEKQRIRSREKYHRLGYKVKQKENDKDKFWKNNTTYKSLRRKHFKDVPKDYELHHWSYKEEFLKDVIILDKRTHKKAHTFLTLDKETLLFKTKDGMLLNTKENHIDYLSKCVSLEQKF